MQILIMTGPHSKVREISLTTRHLVFGGMLSLAVLVGANVAINDLTNQTKDILHAMETKDLQDKRFIVKSEDDYETKLLELQARLDEAQRNLGLVKPYFLTLEDFVSNSQSNVAKKSVNHLQYHPE